MPFKSEAQRRYMWMAHPKIARKWAKKEKKMATESSYGQMLRAKKASKKPLKDTDKGSNRVNIWGKLGKKGGK
jgi:hypothetical protein